jgi:integrase
MAGLSTRKNGSRFVTFKRDGGKRQMIHLGQIDKRKAATIVGHIEELISAAAGNASIKAATSAWLKDIEPDMAEKLVNVGLIQHRQKPVVATLENFLTSYLDSRTKLKPSTRCNLEITTRRLIEKLGADKPLHEITAGDADNWREWLKGFYAENTIRRCCGRARQFFNSAIKHRLIEENPFAEMKDIQVRTNASRAYFISLAEAQTVLDACPNVQWQLLFALCRYGGLRCPSEHVLLRWKDVNFKAGKFTVHSPKTEHHDGHDKRIVPIFAELRPYFEAARAEAPKDAEFVFTIKTMRGHDPQPRTTMEKIIRKSGIKLWPKIFQNLRSTRQTELTQQYPAHVVCQWIGNSEIVAKEHYLQVTQDDFTKAASGDVASDAQLIRQLAVQTNETGKTTFDHKLLLEVVAKCLENREIGPFLAELGKSQKTLAKSQLAPPVGLERTFGALHLHGVSKAFAL